MKTLILIAITLIFINGLSAQSGFRFADSTAQWNELHSEIGNWGAGWLPYYYTDINTVKGDTTFLNRQYQVIGNQPGNGYYQFFIRTDSTRQVFVVTLPDSSEHRIYDFSKNAGDTFNVYDAPVIVDSVDSVTLGGKVRKRMYVGIRSQFQSQPDVWVEGIGSLHYPPTYPFYGWSGVDFPQMQLLCFFEHNLLVYHNTALGDSCVRKTNTGIEDESLTQLKVYPNPANGHQITIEAENSADRNFILCDALGREVKRVLLLQSTQQINIAGLPAGMYYYSIGDEKQKATTGKLVITNP